MCEGRRHPQMTTRTLGLPDMPPQFKSDGGIFKTVGKSGLPPSFDHNKNNLAPKESTNLVNAVGTRHPATTTYHHPPPFTASWLTEVARMTPLRPPERHPFSTGAITGPSVANFYQHYQSLTPRTPFYAPHAFLNPSHYIRNFSHPQQMQGFSHTIDPMSSDFSQTTSGLPSTFMRSLGPPLRPSIDMTRDLHEKSNLNLELKNQRESTDNALSSRPLELVVTQAPHTSSLRTSPKEPQREPNLKKRVIQPTAFTTAIAKPSSSNSLKKSEIPFSQTPAPTQETSANVSSEFLERAENSSSPFHPHFRKGSLVMVGEQIIKKIEDLETNDFLEASQISPELVLDPSTVGAITMNTEKNIATITFKFSSKNKEISVDASDDHPFFVFHKGWSSCNPERTLKKYELPVRMLAVNDVCVSLQRKLCDEKLIQEVATVMPPPKTVPKSAHSVHATSTASTEVSQLPGKLFSSTLQHSSSSTAQYVSSIPSSSFSKLTTSSTVSSPCNISVAQKILKREVQNEKSSGPSCIATWRRPSSTTHEKQKSSDDSQTSVSSFSRKRRWSDPEH